MMFPLLYAMLTSTQSNAEMFRLQMTPGDHFGINLKAVLDRNIVLLMFNTLVVAGLMGIVGWLFATVMDVEKLARDNKLHIQHLLN